MGVQKNHSDRHMGVGHAPVCDQLSTGLDPGPHATSYPTAFLARDPVNMGLHEGRGAAVMGSTENMKLIVGRRESLLRVVVGVSLCTRIVHCQYLTEKGVARVFQIRRKHCTENSINP